MAIISSIVDSKNSKLKYNYWIELLFENNYHYQIDSLNSVFYPESPKVTTSWYGMPVSYCWLETNILPKMEKKKKVWKFCSTLCQIRALTHLCFCGRIKFIQNKVVIEDLKKWIKSDYMLLWFGAKKTVKIFWQRILSLNQIFNFTVR